MTDQEPRPSALLRSRTIPKRNHVKSCKVFPLGEIVIRTSREHPINPSRHLFSFLPFNNPNLSAKMLRNVVHSVARPTFVSLV
jgi:hypothetical protein